MTVHGHYLVTGGAGFIGSHLVERLLRDGCEVSVIDDLSTGSMENLRSVAQHPGLRVIRGKVSECAELAGLIGGAGGVFHLAAAVGVELVIRSPIQTIVTNLSETECVLEAAAPAGVPVLVASTSEVYGKSNKDQFDEEDDLLIGPPRLARWSYACSKLMDEFLAMAYARERQLPVVVARLFNTVGPRQTGRYGMVLPRFIAAAKAGRPLTIYGDGRQTRCFCYVQDTVDALIRLMATPTARGHVFNVGSNTEIAIRDLAALVVKRLSSASALDYLPYDQAYAPGFEDMLRRRPNVEKCAGFTGFRASTSIERIIDLTAASQQ
jgi:UDP-glucose 4-epimerase